MQAHACNTRNSKERRLGTSQAIKLFLSLQKTNLKENRCVDALRYTLNYFQDFIIGIPVYLNVIIFATN